MNDKRSRSGIYIALIGIVIFAIGTVLRMKGY